MVREDPAAERDRALLDVDAVDAEAGLGEPQGQAPATAADVEHAPLDALQHAND